MLDVPVEFDEKDWNKPEPDVLKSQKFSRVRV
jgi:hypothetical protein